MEISSQEVDSANSSLNNHQSDALDASRFARSPSQKEKNEPQDAVTKQTLAVIAAIQEIANSTDHQKKSDGLRRLFPPNIPSTKALDVLQRVDHQISSMNGEISSGAKKIVQQQRARFEKQRERELGGRFDTTFPSVSSSLSRNSAASTQQSSDRRPPEQESLLKRLLGLFQHRRRP